MTSDVAKFITSLGGLHDATVLGLTWNAPGKRLEILIEDIYWNFESFLEYKGPQKATFACAGVRRFDVEIELTAPGLMIYDWKIDELGSDRFVSEISFSPGGRLIIDCATIECIFLPKVR